MPTKTDAFIEHFVLGLGFLGGLLTYVGVNPKVEIIRNLLKISIPNNNSLSTAIILVGTLVTVICIWAIYSTSGQLGLVIVGIAWLSGLIIAMGGYLTIIGAFLIVGALIFGPIAYDIHNR